MQLEESLSQLRRSFTDEMSVIEAMLTRSFEGRRPPVPASLWEAEEPETVSAADPDVGIELPETAHAESEAGFLAHPDGAEPIESPETEPADAAAEAGSLAHPEGAEPIESPETEPAEAESEAGFLAHPDGAEPIEPLEAEPADADSEAVSLAHPDRAEPMESAEAEPADQPPAGLRMENFVSGVATK